MSADLPVPDDSLRYVRELTEDARGTTNDHAYVHAIAAPVVAAVLREEADRITAVRGRGYLDAFVKRGAYNPDAQALARRLRARADQIDGGES